MSARLHVQVSREVASSINSSSSHCHAVTSTKYVLRVLCCSVNECQKAS